MTGRAEHPYPCPACLTTADLDRGCPGCGRTPDPDAAEVVRLDAVLAELATREQQWRHAHAAVLAELDATRTRRNALAARVAASASQPSPPPAPGAAAPAPPAAAAEVSTRTVQTVLFVLGGLLLGTGAIVFTAVAWATFGMTGRAIILGVVTALVLTTPLVANRRGLRGTAETFAVLGLLLVLLDGFAIWSVNLFRVGEVVGSTWAAVVCAVTAAVAVGYARGTRLSGPAYAALLLIQPVVPLAAVEQRPGVSGWAYVWVTLAAVNLAASWWQRRAGLGWRVLAWVLSGIALLIAVGLAMAAVLIADTVPAAVVAGGALLSAVAVVGGVAWVTGAGGWWSTAAAAAVLAVALAAGRVVALAAPDHSLAAVSLVVAVAGVGAAATGWRWRPVRTGARVGGLAATGLVGAFLIGAALVHASASVVAAWLRSAPAGPFDWQLPVAVVAVAAAAATLVPRAWPEMAATGLALTVLAVPPSWELAWPTPAVLDVAALAVLALAAVQVRRARTAGVCAVAAVGLGGHALLVGSATHASIAAVLAGLALLGVAVAVRAERLARADTSETAPKARMVIGRAALLVGLLAVPGAAAAALAAADLDQAWPPRAALAAAALLLVGVALARRAAPAYLATAAAAVHVATPVALLGGLAENPAAVSVYAGVALVVLAATGWLRTPRHPRRWAAVRIPALVMLLAGAVSGQVAMVLAGPYEWLDHIWRGVPAGSGVSVTIGWPDSAAGPVALALLAVASLLAGRVLGWGFGVAGGLLLAPVTALVTMGQLDVAWPALPAASLLIGLAALLGAAFSGGTGRRGGGVATGYGLLLTGAGLAGALPARWSTLAGLAAVLAVTVVIAVVARPAGARAVGWVAAVAVAVLLAVAATRAADLPLDSAALVVLAVAAAALAISVLGRRGRADGVALEAAAHATAMVALVLAVGTLARAALVAALWGVALGLRALWPGASPTGRLARVGAAVGVEVLAWWLLAASQQVTTLEAYTVPAAVAAAAVGGLALRSRPRIGSWVAFAPALTAGFLPSLYATLVDPQPLRRLLLGAAAVAVLVVGAGRRWQAPVLLGGAVVLVVALRELALVWQQLPSWIPLTVAGLLVVGVAATYERRRRDLARLRESVRRMT